MPKRTVADRLERPAWPVAAEQIEPLTCLLDPTTHGGVQPGYAETALSHIAYVADTTYVLRRPMNAGGANLMTPSARWRWCEDRAEQLREERGVEAASVVPIVRRGGRIGLGGPGDVQDWVLKRIRRRGVDVRQTEASGPLETGQWLEA